MKKLMLVLIISCVVVGVFVISCAVLGVFAGGTQDENSNLIVVASDCTWPPMEFIDENKEIVGFDIDLMNAIAEAGGFEVEIKNTAWDGIFAGLANKNYDAVISSVTITDERKKTMDFSIPYINAGQVLIINKDLSGVSGLQDMSGMKVGAQIGTTGAFAIEEADGVELKNFDELGLAVEALAQGKIEGVVADTPIAADYVMNNDNYKNALMIVGEPFTEEYYGIAVAKGNKEVLEKINAGIKAVIDSGKDQELIDKWLR